MPANMRDACTKQASAQLGVVAWCIVGLSQSLGQHVDCIASPDIMQAACYVNVQHCWAPHFRHSPRQQSPHHMLYAGPHVHLVCSCCCRGSKRSKEEAGQPGSPDRWAMQLMSALVHLAGLQIACAMMHWACDCCIVPHPVMQPDWVMSDLVQCSKQ
jgi:hypothetical protein